VTSNYVAAHQPQAATTTTPTKDSDDGLISKELLGQLKGIPVDVNSLMDTIADLEYKASLGIPISGKTVRAIEARINQVV
jgi:hypothetical protein